MDDYSEFIGMIKEFITVFDELIPVEQKKLSYAVENKVSFVEKCMNQEQAFILKLRGLEQKLGQTRDSLGMGGLSFREIIDSAPAGTKSSLQPLFHELTEKLKLFRSILDSANDAIEVNLHMIRRQMASSGEDVSYSPSGSSPKDEGPRFLGRSV